MYTFLTLRNSELESLRRIHAFLNALGTSVAFNENGKIQGERKTAGPVLS